MAIKLADTARPNNYVDSEHLGTFPVAYAEDVWFEDGTRLSEKTFDGQSIQKEELPLASATELGKVYQYIGTSGTYQHGCFYECVNDSDSDYEWKELRVIKNAIVYTDTEPTIGEYTEGSVIVYSGENTNAYKKGHHYKYVVGEPHTLNLFTGENVTIPATTYLRVLEDELVVGAHTYNEAGDNSGYIISVGEDSVEYYSYYYSQVMTVTNIQKGASSTINITDYLDIGGGDDGNDYEEFVGTQAEWKALPQSQKNKYDGKVVNITDDTVSETVVDSVTPNDMNPVTSNAVADCTGYIDTMMLVGDEFDTTYQDGSSSQQYNITTGLYRVHVYLYNPTNEKTSNRCLIQRYENGTAKATLFDFNYTGSGAIQQQNYIRVKSGTIGVTHEASGGSVGGRCYFVLHKVSESH